MNSEMLKLIDRVSFEVQSTALSFHADGHRLLVSVSCDDDIFSQNGILCDLVEALRNLDISFKFVSAYTFSIFMD